MAGTSYLRLAIALGLGLVALPPGLLLVSAEPAGKSFEETAQEYAAQLLEDGKKTFRFDTFGSEDVWGRQGKRHQAIAGEKLGGVGPGVSPETALKRGLKVDANAIPPEVADALSKGKVDLKDPASTMVLLKANAVVGVTGF